jgi:hypothetical protein
VVELHSLKSVRASKTKKETSDKFAKRWFDNFVGESFLFSTAPNSKCNCAGSSRRPDYNCGNFDGRMRSIVNNLRSTFFFSFTRPYARGNCAGTTRGPQRPSLGFRGTVTSGDNIQRTLSFIFTGPYTGSICAGTT